MITKCEGVCILNISDTPHLNCYVVEYLMFHLIQSCVNSDNNNMHHVIVLSLDLHTVIFVLYFKTILHSFHIILFEVFLNCQKVAVE